MFLPFVSAILACALLIFTVPAGAQEPARFALLIGNQGYQRTVGELRNPHNDLAVVGKALGQIGFKGIQSKRDASRDEMLFAVHDLASQLRAAGSGAIGFVYYTGHGVSVGGENVLVPVNTANTTDAELRVRGVKLTEVLDILKSEAPQAVLFIVLDACRSNIAGQRGAKGFSPVNDQRTGVVIAFSTAAGETASDDGSSSGPYAAALAEEIVKPGASDQTVFNAVRTRVARQTKNQQIPWTHDGLVGERVVFNSVRRAVATAAGQMATSASAEVERGWDLVKNSRSVAVLEAFAKQFPGTVHAALASERLTDLQREALAAKAKEDQQRLALLRQQEMDRKRVADEAVARRKAEEDARRDPLLALKPGSGQSARDRLANGQPCPMCPEMVAVPSGSFTMGSSAAEIEALTKEFPSGKEWWQAEAPQRKVTMSSVFAAGKFAVTFDEWDACVADGGCNGYKPADQGWGRGKLPVINVNWDDAKAYAAWLSRKTGKTYRLLSEAEREYVARAGTTTAFWWGNSISTQQANYYGNSTYAGSAKGEYRQRTLPVDSFEANPWGLHQVHGNVWEWTEDCWHASYQGAPSDGTAWTTACTVGSRRVLRGGSWDYYPVSLGSASSRNATDYRFDNLGLRVGRTLAP